MPGALPEIGFLAALAAAAIGAGHVLMRGPVAGPEHHAAATGDGPVPG